MSEDIAARLRELACISGHGELGDAADELTRLRGEVERLTRERDEAFQKYVDANEARIDAEAKVAKLREVLLPFADIGEWSEDFFDASMASVDVALGDLRRARAVLQETEQ